MPENIEQATAAPGEKRELDPEIAEWLRESPAGGRVVPIRPSDGTNEWACVRCGAVLRGSAWARAHDAWHAGTGLKVDEWPLTIESLGGESEAQRG